MPAHQAAQGSKPADTILLTRRLILEPLVEAHAAALYPAGLQTRGIVTQCRLFQK